MRTGLWPAVQRLTYRWHGALRIPAHPDQEILAERQGFEPWITHKAIPDFESGAFDHSAIFPHGAKL